MKKRYIVIDDENFTNGKEFATKQDARDCITQDCLDIGDALTPGEYNDFRKPYKIAEVIEIWNPIIEVATKVTLREAEE